MSLADPDDIRSLETMASDVDSIDDRRPGRVYGIYPYNRLRRSWEFIIFFLAMACLCQLPYEFAFNLERTFLYILPSLIIDLFFLVDIFIVLRTGVLRYGIIKLDQDTILKSIDRRRLIIYWFSPWPYYLVSYFMQSDAVFLSLLLLKSLRFLRLYDSAQVIRNTLLYIGPFSRMAILYGIWLTIAHFSACTFWVEIPGESWLITFKLTAHPKAVQYFYSLYDITTSFLTIGYGDLHPITFSETCVGLVVEAVGAFFYNFVVSNLVSIVANPSRNSFLSKYQRVSSAFQQHNVSPESMAELLKYYEYIWERNRDRADFYETVTKLPLGLQKRVALALHMDVFTKVDALRGANPDALEEVAMALRQRVFAPGDCIIRVGKVTNRMLFVTAGKVSVKKADDSEVMSFDGASGFVLGVESVWRGTKDQASAIAESYVEAFELLKADFDTIAAAHPEVQEEIGRRLRI
jgi:hyperpolarization activated cyclic nucleotide-gated potassium channel 2